MIYWSAVFFIIAIVAAAFGFGGISAGAVDIAKVLFFIFLVLFILSALFGFARRGGRGTRLCPQFRVSASSQSMVTPSLR